MVVLVDHLLLGVVDLLDPFVGMFLARISRGRTIRQFVVGVIVVPSAVSLVWFAIFGGAGISEQRDGIDLAGQDTQEGQLFGMLNHLPLTGITTVLVMVLVGIFFVSGADAASMVMGTLSQRGSLERSAGWSCSGVCSPEAWPRSSCGPAATPRSTDCRR